MRDWPTDDPYAGLSGIEARTRQFDYEAAERARRERSLADPSGHMGAAARELATQAADAVRRAAQRERVALRRALRGGGVTPRAIRKAERKVARAERARLVVAFVPPGPGRRLTDDDVAVMRRRRGDI